MGRVTLTRPGPREMTRPVNSPGHAQCLRRPQCARRTVVTCARLFVPACPYPWPYYLEALGEDTLRIGLWMMHEEDVGNTQCFCARTPVSLTVVFGNPRRGHLEDWGAVGTRGRLSKRAPVALSPCFRILGHIVWKLYARVPCRLGCGGCTRKTPETRAGFCPRAPVFLAVMFGKPRRWYLEDWGAVGTRGGG